ncbi:MAG: histidinol-phosphatase HisJ family protein [Clostridia bacterium]|nr:histidinol-phosphatase HisJ family protein [Clostridia bacterium]
MIKQNLHTHSLYVDGKDSLAAMAREAYERGFDSLGFSEHGITDFDARFSLSNQSALEYAAEVAALKAEYAGKMEIFCGVEQDYYSFAPNFKTDYIIGSVHYAKKGDVYYIFDTANVERMLDGIEKYWNGDRMLYCEEYFSLVTQLPEKTGCNIIGHFDIITKMNEQKGLFDTEAPRYINAALCAVDSLCDKDMIFEINTGAMARGFRTTPYPSLAILRRIKEKGGRILFSSDCHNKTNLEAGMDLAHALALEAGFKEFAYLTADGFADMPIEE